MRHIGDAVKASFIEFVTAVKQGLGMNSDGRVESARITSTRLKAMERPDDVKERLAAPPAEKDPLELATDEIVASPNARALNRLGLAVPQMPGGPDVRKRTAADMSHFRLAAYVSTLSPEQVEAQEKVLSEKESQ